jgi:hypothetical protein
MHDLNISISSLEGSFGEIASELRLVSEMVNFVSVVI